MLRGLGGSSRPASLWRKNRALSPMLTCTCYPRAYSTTIMYTHPAPPPPEKKPHPTLSLETVELIRKLRAEDPVNNTQRKLAKQFNVCPFYIAVVAPAPEEARKANIERNKANAKKNKLKDPQERMERRKRLYEWLRKYATIEYQKFRQKQLESLLPKEPPKKNVLERAYDIYRGRVPGIPLSERKHRVKSVKVRKYMEKQKQKYMDYLENSAEGETPRHLRDKDDMGGYS